MWWPVFLLILVRLFLKPLSEPVWVDALGAVLFVTLELIALGCGIAGRRTTDGIAGTAMSVCALLLFGVVVVLLTVMSPSMMH